MSAAEAEHVEVGGGGEATPADDITVPEDERTLVVSNRVRMVTHRCGRSDVGG